jgi:hypothetical protein
MLRLIFVVIIPSIIKFFVLFVINYVTEKFERIKENDYTHTHTHTHTQESVAKTGFD